MKTRKFGGRYEERIKRILRANPPKMQSTKLFNEARKPYNEISDSGKVIRNKGMGPNTTSYYLKILIKKGQVDRILDPKHPKEKYYAMCKNPKTIVITEEAVNRVKAQLERLPEEINKSIEREFNYFKESSEDLTEVEEREAYMDISGDIDKIEYIVAIALVKEGMKFLERVYPRLKGKKYYVDADCRTMPKNLVDERITWEESLQALDY
jgi:hypothetical protein